MKAGVFGILCVSAVTLICSHLPPSCLLIIALLRLSASYGDLNIFKELSIISMLAFYLRWGDISLWPSFMFPWCLMILSICSYAYLVTLYFLSLQISCQFHGVSSQWLNWERWLYIQGRFLLLLKWKRWLYIQGRFLLLLLPVFSFGLACLFIQV